MWCGGHVQRTVPSQLGGGKLVLEREEKQSLLRS